MRKVYLSNIRRQEALDIFLSRTEISLQEEKIKVAEALGRVTSRAVFADLSMPGYHAAAMDGIAVSAEKTFGTSDQTPLSLKKGEDFKFVDTGNPIPDGCDAVIKIEDIQLNDNDDSALILAPATPWQHVRSVGEDVVAGEMILTARHRLRPPDLGALLAGGITEVAVAANLKAAVIPTGSEVVNPGSPRNKGTVPDFNSTVIRAYLNEWGAEAEISPIIPDDLQKIKEAIANAAAKADMVIVIAGSSAGRKDYTYQAFSELGEVFLHGVATRPGKPTILGSVNGKPAVGLPGYPVSAYLSLEWFVRPLIYRYRGEILPEREKLKVYLGKRVVSEIGSEEHVRMAVGHIEGKFIANPLDRGAGVTTSLVRADGILVIPGESMGYERGSEVEIELFRPRISLENNLLAAGSHDLIIDMMATTLKERYPQFTLSSAHLGSMGGINAIDKGEAHFAGLHLFHPESGDYNLPYIEKYLAAKKVVLITMAYRMQGWIISGGNPQGIKDIKDLERKKISYINRQRGAGTRLLFDYLLNEAGINPRNISGYQREEYTHLNVAAAVASGNAGAGLGILPAAKAFGLDFIPVAEERYDLLMTEDFYRSSPGKTLIEIITDPIFQKTVEALGGYSMREAGLARSGV